MSSPFAQAVTLVDTMASHVAMLTTTRIHPGSGDTADAADALAQDVAHRAILTEDWLTETAALAQQQVATDDILSAAPKPEDLESWHEQWSALPEGEQREAEMKAWLHDAAKRQEALAIHTAETISGIPALPEGVCTVPVDSLGGESSEGGGKPKSEDGFNGEGVDEEGSAPEPGADAEKPVTMTPAGTPETPVTMSTGAPREAPVTMSDSAANTELSSSTMTSDPAARPSLSGQMTQGQGTPQVSAAGQPAAVGGVPLSQQLSQPTQRGGTGTAPRSPEKRREEQDKRDERDATVQAVSGVGLAGASGAMTAAAMAPNTPSPGTTTSGATSTPVTPNATPTNPAPQGAPPAGGAGMAGMPRGGSLGSGNNVSAVKPVISAEQPTPPLTPEEQRLLDAYNKDDKK